jgi:hypothetical protein
MLAKDVGSPTKANSALLSWPEFAPVENESKRGPISPIGSDPSGKAAVLSNNTVEACRLAQTINPPNKATILDTIFLRTESLFDL